MNEKPDNQTLPPPIKMAGVDIAAIRDPGLILFQNITWTVASGEFWVIGAPPQSGKSDFLMTVAGLASAVGGRYEFYGKETHVFDESRLADRLRMGFIFEDAQLFHYLTVWENVALPMRYHKNLRIEDTPGLMDPLLEATRLKPIADMTPSNLPRSWHKRASLARALVLQPDILLADNPLGALDARHSNWWLQFLDALWRGHAWLGGKPLTIVITTDDFRPWRGSGRKFALLKNKSFVPLGSWNEVISADEPLIRELLAAPLEEEPTEPLKR